MVVVTALPSQPAPRLAVLVVALEQTLPHLHRLPYTRATEALEAEAEAACLPPMLLLLAVLAAHDLARLLELLAARPALRVLLVLHLLLADCSDREAAVAAVALLQPVVRAVQEAEVLAAGAVQAHAVHSQPVLAA